MGSKSAEGSALRGETATRQTTRSTQEKAVVDVLVSAHAKITSHFFPPPPELRSVGRMIPHYVTSSIRGSATCWWRKYSRNCAASAPSGLSPSPKWTRAGQLPKNRPTKVPAEGGPRAEMQAHRENPMNVQDNRSTVISVQLCSLASFVTRRSQPSSMAAAKWIASGVLKRYVARSAAARSHTAPVSGSTRTSGD